MLGFFIELKGHGGVQRLGRHTAAVLDEFCRDRSMELDILSFADPDGTHEFEFEGRRIRWAGCGRGRARTLRAIHAARPDLACVGHPFIAPFVHTRRLTKPGFRYMVHVHGIEMWSPMSLPRRLALRGATLVSATSRNSAEQAVLHQRIDAARTRVLYPALDPALDSATAGGFNPPKPYILTVARLGKNDALKYVDEAIRSFADLACHHPEWHHVIIGDGDDRPRLEAIARGRGVAGRVHFLGKVDDAVLMQAYSECELFILPSAKEGLGIVFLEAMRYGKPLLGAKSGGIPEVVRNDQNGFCVTVPGKELTAKLSLLMENLAIREKMGESGKRFFDQEFSLASFRARLTRILEELSIQSG